MNFHFFEEYCEEENLNKLRLIPWKCDLFLASISLHNFLKDAKKIKKEYKNVRHLIYWPTLSSEEGYWMSPFAKYSAVKRIIEELEHTKKKQQILWDAELPMLRKKLFMTAIPSFLFNRTQIRYFLKQTKHNVYTAEYGYDTTLLETLYRFLGISFDPKNIPHKKILMLYTSYLHKGIVEDYFLRHIQYHQNSKQPIFAGLGTIAKGIEGNEPILSPKRLAHDLSILQKEKIKEVVIYRLGGLNTEYVKILANYK